MEICGAASYEVRQAYKQFIGAVVELIDGEVHPEELREVALAVYRLFGTPEEEDYAEANIAGKKLESRFPIANHVQVMRFTNYGINNLHGY